MILTDRSVETNKRLKMDMLNEKGLELLELKKALETTNDLVRNPLVQSVQAMKLKQSLKDGLLSENSWMEFLDALVKQKAYLDKEKYKNRYGAYIELLEKHLNQRNIPVQYEITFDRAVVIVKKYGADFNFAKRHFKMTDDEFKDAVKSGFVDTFLRNLALSLKRDMEEKMKMRKKWTTSSEANKVKTTIGDVYVDADTGYYNVDVKMKLTDYESLTRNGFAHNISVEIEKILEFLQGSYFRRMHTKD